MKKSFFFLSATACMLTGMTTGCKSSQSLYLETTTPEEHGIAPVKITDESQNSVVANLSNLSVISLNGSGYGGYRDKGFFWNTGKRVAVSPDGTELAYISNVNDSRNVMVKKSTAGGPSTQRTFRRAQNVFWGNDNRLYFNDNTSTTSTLGSVDSKQGSLVKQLTSNNNDWGPSLSADGKVLYFTRFDSSGPYIWSLNTATGELTSCTRGFGPIVDGDDSNKIYCVRNSTKGNSEIWHIDLAKGDEMLVLSDTKRGFTDPAVSPDGKWLLVVGNALSSITKRQNTDIFAVRTDGSQLTQITYHPETDCSPAWSPDGKYIYFLSSRGNKDRKFNIWRIENPLLGH